MVSQRRELYCTNASEFCGFGPNLLWRILARRFVPRLFPSWENRRVFGLQFGQNALGDIGCKLDFPIQFAIAISRINAGRPRGRADRDDEASSNEKRWPHLRPVRNIVVAADFHRRNRLGECKEKRQMAASIP